MRHGVEHPARQRLLHADQPVHRPVAGVIGHAVVAAGQAGQVHIVGDPRGRRQLRGRGQGPVGDQREHHPLHHRIPSGASGQTVQQGVDPQPVPQPVQQPRPTQRAGLGERQPRQPDRPGPVRTRPVGGGLRAQHPGQGGDQPLDRGPVELVGATEGVQHLRAGGLRRRIPLVVDQLQVRHPRPVLVASGRRTHEHVTRPYTTTGSSNHQQCPIRVTRRIRPGNQPSTC